MDECELLLDELECRVSRSDACARDWKQCKPG